MIFFTHLLAQIHVSADQVGAPDVSLSGVPKIAVDVLLEIAGALSVIFIVVGGLKYTTSAGDPKATASAKNTILYAIVGLVVSSSAYAIVHYVLGAI